MSKADNSTITSEYTPTTFTMVTAVGAEFDVYDDMPISTRRRIDQAMAKVGEMSEKLEPYDDEDDNPAPDELLTEAVNAQREFREAAYDVLRSRVVEDDRERFDETDIYEKELYQLIGDLQRVSDERAAEESGRPTKKSSSPSRSSKAKKATRDSTES